MRKSKYSHITDEEIINACKTSMTMAEASRKLNMGFRIFRDRASKLGVYNPNIGSKGVKGNGIKKSLEDIFSNKQPAQSFKLKHRLYEEGLKENKCEICGISEWNGFPIKCQLDHIDGNKFNNALENLRIICPNCHSQTDNFGFKGGRKYWIEQYKIIPCELKWIHDDIYIEKIINKIDKNNKKNDLIEKVKNSNIDFSKKTWIKETSKVINISPASVKRWMKHNMLEFFEKFCYNKTYNNFK